MTTLFIYTAVPPTNVRATVLTPRSIEVTWNAIRQSYATGYLISYTTTASYTYGRSVRVYGHTVTNYTLTNLEENTLYTVTVQGTYSGSGVTGVSAISNKFSIKTYTDGKMYINIMSENVML